MHHQLATMEIISLVADKHFDVLSSIGRNPIYYTPRSYPPVKHTLWVSYSGGLNARVSAARTAWAKQLVSAEALTVTEDLLQDKLCRSPPSRQLPALSVEVYDGPQAKPKPDSGESSKLVSQSVAMA